MKWERATCAHWAYDEDTGSNKTTATSAENRFAKQKKMCFYYIRFGFIILNCFTALLWAASQPVIGYVFFFSFFFLLLLSPSSFSSSFCYIYSPLCNAMHFGEKKWFFKVRIFHAASLSSRVLDTNPFSLFSFLQLVVFSCCCYLCLAMAAMFRCISFCCKGSYSSYIFLQRAHLNVAAYKSDIFSYLPFYLDLSRNKQSNNNKNDNENRHRDGDNCVVFATRKSNLRTCFSIRIFLFIFSLSTTAAHHTTLLKTTLFASFRFFSFFRSVYLIFQ